MKENNLKDGNKKRILIVISVIILAILVVTIILVLRKRNGFGYGVPVLTVETPQKIAMQDNKFVTVDMSISDIGDVLYPAMSVSLVFDSTKLEFLGVEEGNVFVLDNVNAVGSAQKLPDWNCNIQKSNESGKINIMYLDITGGKYAFSRDLLKEKNNVLFRLNFKLRGSVESGDALDLIVEDAVFAASDETQSLAMTTDTLKVRNGKIVIGE